MKGLEKLTSVRLAEVLSQRNLVPTESITDALYAQDHFGERFVDVLVSAGHIAEWELAKVVVDHFQVPFVMASNYDVPTAAKERLPKDVLFEHLIVPLDVFGPGMTIAMPIMTRFEELDHLQRTYDVDLFPSVGLISENKRFLQELFPEFGDWQQEQERQLEAKRAKKSAADPEERDWMNIFDTGDKAVRNQIRGR